MFLCSYGLYRFAQKPRSTPPFLGGVSSVFFVFVFVQQEKNSFDGQRPIERWTPVHLQTIGIGEIEKFLKER